MDANRRGRIESTIQQELNVLISKEIKDPRVLPLTITSVKMTQDASHATVMVLLFGQMDELGSDVYRQKMDSCLEGLNSAAGFLRHELTPILQIRYVPQLTFKEDRGLENSFRVNELLKQIKEES